MGQHMTTDILEYPIGWRAQKGSCMSKRGWIVEAIHGKSEIHIHPDCYKTDPCRHDVSYSDGSRGVLSYPDIVREYSDRGLMHELPSHFGGSESDSE
jgi:hypothetical protein